MTRKSSIYAVASLLLGGLLASGCTPSLHASDANRSAPYACHIGNKMVQTTLYFGLNRPAGPPVSDAEWEDFVDHDVTPRFKDGLTIVDSQGQWLGQNGVVVRESSKALLLIHSSERESDVEALRTVYKTRFAQESVMRVDVPACVAF
ncbi:DUF3574 domain-containing protein [Brenneria sp. 4F2]|nr:DUF3574 domain-containing protein [Brenneria bubanii]